MQFERFNTIFFLGIATLALTACSPLISRIAYHIETPTPPPEQVIQVLEHEANLFGFKHSYIRLSNDQVISYWYGVPRNYGVSFHTRRHHGHLVWLMSWIQPPYFFKQRTVASIGTVILLHGWSMSGVMMLPWAVSFAQRGYIVIMPDLPGQGQSIPGKIGYGPSEADEISRFLSIMRFAGMVTTPIYLFGFSYGASVALFMSNNSYVHPYGIIALGPYSNAEDVIMRAPSSGLFGPEQTTKFVTRKDMLKAIHIANHNLDINLSKIIPNKSVRQGRVCTIILHGSKDKLISSRSLRALLTGDKWVQYFSLAGLNHITLGMDVNGLSSWLARWMRSVSLTHEAKRCPNSVKPPNDLTWHPPFLIHKETLNKAYDSMDPYGIWTFQPITGPD